MRNDQTIRPASSLKQKFWLMPNSWYQKSAHHQFIDYKLYFKHFEFFHSFVHFWKKICLGQDSFLLSKDVGVLLQYVKWNLSYLLVSQRKIRNRTVTGKQVTYIGYCYTKHNMFASLRSPVDFKSTFCFVVQQKLVLTCFWQFRAKKPK